MTKLNFHIEIPDDLNSRLIGVMSYLKRSKASVMKEALEDFIFEIEEQRRDLPLIKKILRSKKPGIPLKDVMKDLGVHYVED